jgi:hypothetical protein
VENEEAWVPGLALPLRTPRPWACCLSPWGPWAHLLNVKIEVNHFKDLFNSKILYLVFDAEPYHGLIRYVVRELLI